MAQVATINPLNQFFDLNGSPLNSGKLYFGAANQDPEQYPVQMYWDEAGLVPALQPIRTTSGYPSRSGSPAILYCATKYSLRVRNSRDVQVFYIPEAGTEADADFDAFSPTNLTPSFVSVNSFTVTGDQTAVFPTQIRVRAAVTAGNVYGTVVSAVFGALTTVTLTMDAGDALDAGLSSVAVGFSPNESPIPANYATSSDLQSQTYTAFTTTGTSTALVLTPTPAITANSSKLLFANFHVAPTGTPTLAVSGLTALPLKYRDWTGSLQTVTGAQCPINWRSPIYTDGTNWILLVVNAMGSGTTQATTSGSNIDFTGIPAGTRRITINFAGVSTNGTNGQIVQIGDSGGLETSGYLGASITTTAGGNGAGQYNTSGFGIRATAAADVIHGSMVLTLLDAATNTWVQSGMFHKSNAAEGVTTSGSKSLTATLDRLRITTNSAEVFDAGLINILYE